MTDRAKLRLWQAYWPTCVLLSCAALHTHAYAGDGKLTLEMLYHPTEKLKFDPVPLTRMAWDEQNRLIETQSKDGIVKRFVVDPKTWQKTPLEANGEVLKWLKTAGIEEKTATGLADTLSKQLKPDTKRLIFTHKNDIWLLDLHTGTARAITHTPDVAEDEAVLSPDTEHVAYLKANDLYLSDIATGTEKKLTTGGSETVFNGRLDWVYQEEVYGRGSYRAFWWSPDSQRIAFLSLDETKVPVYTLSGDHTQPIKTERIRYPKVGDSNPIAKLGVVDLQANLSWQQEPYPSQETLIVQVGWKPDGQLLAAWQDRIQTWLDLRLYDSAGASTLAIHETSPAWTARLPLPEFLKDGSFLWQSDRTGHRHLYLYGSDYTLRKAVTQGDWDIRAVEGVDELQQRVLFSATKNNLIGNDIYHINLDGNNLQRLSQEKGSHNVSWNKTYTYYLDSWSSITQTPRQALFDADGKQVQLIDDHGLPTAMRDLQLATVKQQQIKTRDGFEMESLLYLPPNFDATKKYPIYQQIYGGPMAPLVTDRWNSNLWYHFLAQQGYVVWILDNRSASNKGAVSAWPFYKKIGQLELQDQLDGLNWLTQQGWADMRRISLSGWSYGGYMTAYAMTHSKAWKIGFVGAPVTDFRLYDSIYTERYMGLSKDNAAGYDQGSVLKAAKNLNGPILIMHGTVDDNVHPQNTVILIDELIKAGKDYSLQIYPGQAHGVRGGWINWSMQKARWNFLKENL
jgi:dipeptidyl-peptidase-4